MDSFNIISYFSVALNAEFTSFTFKKNYTTSSIQVFFPLILGVPSGKSQRGEFDNLLWDMPNGPS